MLQKMQSEGSVSFNDYFDNIFLTWFRKFPEKSLLDCNGKCLSVNQKSIQLCKNECETGTHACDEESSHCLNTTGSYLCISYTVYAKMAT